MIKMQVNSNATKQMETVIAKIGTFPNMIASAQNRAVQRTISGGYDKMYRYGMGAKYVDYHIMPSGKLGMKIIIKPEGTPSTREFIAGAVFLGGRKGGTIIKPSPGKKALRLRQESISQGYPEFLRSARLSGMRGFKSEIKRDIKELFISELQDALRAVGFGPRGGIPKGMSDFTGVRQRFPKRRG